MACAPSRPCSALLVHPCLYLQKPFAPLFQKLFAQLPVSRVANTDSLQPSASACASSSAASVLHLNVLLRSIFVGHILVCSCLLGCLKAVFNRPSVRPFLVGVQWHRCESGDVDSETYIYMPLHANKTRAGTWSLKSRASEWRIDMTRTPE